MKNVERAVGSAVPKEHLQELSSPYLETLTLIERMVRAVQCLFCRRFNWHMGLNNLGSLLQLRQAPAYLISSRSHDVLLHHHRMRFLATRVGAASMFLGIATVAWILIDVVLFQGNWDIVLPLAAGRLVTAALFVAIGSVDASTDCQQRPIAVLGLMLLVGIAFYFFAHAIVGYADEAAVASAGHAQYMLMLMPIALAVGISLFPLTLIEAMALAALPLTAFLVETLLFDGGQVWMHPGVAALLICLIMLTTTTSAMSQLTLLKELHEKSAVDALTGAVSRRAGIDLLNITFEQSRRLKIPLSLVLFDLDHFKSVNDRHGHDAGDQLLREVVAGLKRRLRQQHDTIIRWGGEELLVALPGASVSDAAEVVSALCRNGLALRPDGTPQTASAGLAERESDQAEGWQELVEKADVRMYVAKGLGRNHLCGPAELSLRLFPGERAVIEDRADGPSLLPKIADQDRIPRLSV